MPVEVLTMIMRRTGEDTTIRQMQAERPGVEIQPEVLPCMRW